MKKIIIILAIFLMPFIASAQKNFDKLAREYKNEKGITIVQLDKDLIDLYKRDNLDQEYLDVLKKIKSVNILTASSEMGSATGSNKHLNNVRKCFNLDKYKLIKSRTDQDGFAKVYVKKDGQKISELLVINSAESTSFALIMLSGDLKISNLHKLSYALKIEGLESLSELNTRRPVPFHASRNYQKKQLKKMKAKSKELKKNLKEISDLKDEKDFEEAMEEFGEAMEKWGENFGENLENVLEQLGESLEKISDNVVIDDENYNITLGGDKTTIHITPDDDAVCLIDGVKVSNSKIKDLDRGDINRVRIIKRKKNDEKYLIITTNKKIGKLNYRMNTSTKVSNSKSGKDKSSNSEDIKFTYKGKVYKYKVGGKNFAGYILNGKKISSLKNKSTEHLIQIRPISKDEKKAFGIKENRIIIETK